jgi:hypothetical protein
VKIPLESYNKTGVAVSMSGGVLRSKFLISNNMIPNWKMFYSTVDSSFTLWSASDLWQDIDGGETFYRVNGMLQAADMQMKGPVNSDGNNYLLLSPSFIMDFGTDAKAKAMYDSSKGRFFDIPFPGYDTSMAFAVKALGSITVYSYCKQFFFNFTLDRYSSADTACAHAKVFLDYWRSKAQ